MRYLHHIHSRRQYLYIGVCLIVHIYVIINAVSLSRDIIYGDGSAQSLISRHVASMVRVPDNPLTQKHNAVNRLGMDFAQIYFPAQDFKNAEQAYEWDKSGDPWGRPSRYAPFIHFICSKLLCGFDYGFAYLIHMAFQVLVFYAFLYMACRILDLRKHFINLTTLFNYCIFLTPVGVYFLIRGQFSLYVGLGYLWILLAIYKQKPLYMVVAAFFCFIKWTSLPLAFVITAMWILTSPSIEAFKSRIASVAYFGLTFLILLLSFYEAGLSFLYGLMEQETGDIYHGMSLVRYLPVYAVKAIPYVLLVAGAIISRRNKFNSLQAIPYIVGSSILLHMYPAFAFEYNLPALFIFLPLLILWSNSFVTKQHIAAVGLTVYFSVFLVMASNSVHFNILFNNPQFNQLFFIASAMVFMVSTGLKSQEVLNQEGND